MDDNKGNISIKHKLLKYCELNNISKTDFYLICGLSNGFLDKGKGFNVDSLVRILNAYPDIDANWLIRGDTEIQPKSKNKKIGAEDD